ncbi:proclotting enzyme-like [Trichogramma pretiosum]|uniref:proclotting enzyme-like n=1 Tax=Trichogramma pretiosum TaxID=7493 RepID=UPI000C71AADA|nr:proclotting enzyme-like [Trichogramma pretiosum]
MADGQLVPLAESARAARQMQFDDRGACLTAKGAVGKCGTFKECFPYFKIPDIGALDGWVLGIYDTCSYVQNGRLSFGICCADPPKLPIEPGQTTEPANSAAAPSDDVAGPIVEPADDDNDQLVNRGGRYPIEGSWPPPLPTHPPYHTIPPLPTHPPGFGTRPPTTWPTKYPPSSSLVSRPTVPIVTIPTTPGPVQQFPPSSLGGSCGAKNGDQDSGKIVGGTTTQPGEWPWIAGLFNAGRHICGGSLIDDRHILTAAHCVAQMTSWDVARLTVRLGDYDIKTPNEVRHVERRVQRVVRHRGFDMRTLYNDVALLTLNEPVQFSETIRPVCLPSGANLYSGKRATVIGWGSLREGGPAPGKLQQVTIPVWSNAVCKQKYGSFAPGGIVESFLCAGQAEKDSCSGDSGGPLMVNDGRWTQVGIVSWGIGCGKGQFPGVYTRVTHFLPWISKNLK